MISRITKLVALLVIVTTAESALAAPDASTIPAGSNINWQVLGPSGGGWYMASAFSPSNPNMICVGGDVCGFMISFDQGKTFQARCKGLTDYYVEQIAICPTNDNIIVMACAGGIFRTTDKGLNWAASNSGLTGSLHINKISFCSNSPSTVYISMDNTANSGTWNGGIFKSTDAGQHWTSATGNFPANIHSGGMTADNPQSIVVNLTNANIAYVANFSYSERGVYKTTNGGTTWSECLLANYTAGWVKRLQTPSPWALSICPGHPELLFEVDSMQLYITTNSGSSWMFSYCQMVDSSKFNGNGANLLCPLDIVFDKNDPNHILFCFGDVSMLISHDRGASYRCCKGGVFSGSCGTAVVDADANPKVIWATSGATALAKSTDDGTNWVSCTNGLPGGGIGTIIMDPTSSVGSRTLFVTISGSGVYKSANGGTSWSSINGNLPAYGTRGLLLDPNNNQHLIVALGGNAIKAGPYETINCGASWTRLISDTNTFYDIRSLRADSNNFSRLYIAQRHAYVGGHGYSGGAFKSTDGGHTWTLMITAPAYCKDVAVNPANPNILYASFADDPYHDNLKCYGIARSTDGGTNWATEWTGLSTLQGGCIVINPHDYSEVWYGNGGVGFCVGIDPDVAPDFLLTATPSSRAITAGNNTTYTDTVTASNGFNGTVSSSVGGLPGGASGSFNPASVTGSGSSTLTVTTSANTPPGTYTLTNTGTSGGLVHQATVTLTINASGGGLPAGWADIDVGAVGVIGSASHASGVFTVSGSGSDIWGTSDQFNYAYRSATNDVTLTAHVVSQDGANAWAKSGVMLRESTATNARYVGVYLTPSNGVSMQFRSASGASAIDLARQTGLTAPYWVRLTRSGSTFTGYSSADDATWTLVGQTNITMAANITAGLAVCSHNNSAMNTALFDNVSILPALLLLLEGSANGAQLRLQWAGWAEGLALESTTDLSPPVNWLPVTNGTALSNGISLPLDGGQRFIRLRGP